MTAQASIARRAPYQTVLLEPAVRRLAALAPLSREELALVRGLDGISESAAHGREIVAEDAVLVRPLVILDGWGARQRVLPDGRRQIFGFLLPGDAIGLGREPTALEASPTVALTRMSLLAVPALRAAVADERWPGLAKAVRQAAWQDEARLVDHITRIGRQSAYERVAHLLLEMRARLAVAGLAEGPKFPLPLTQEVMADALGLSIVHVNRVLQQLRRERMLELHGGRVRLLEPALLATIADYPQAH
jgi:CRP-like cAMP-binding protein